MTPRQLILPTAQTFAVNSANDLYIDESGNIAIVYDLQAVLQACRQAGLTIAGEMILQTDQGIPYFTAVWVGVPNMVAFEGALRAAWLAVPGVIGVSSLITAQSDITIPGTNRTTFAVTFTATIETIYGTGNIASEDIFNG